MSDVWHRFEDVHYAGPLDEFDRPCGEGHIAVEHREYPVVSVTRRGVWLGIGSGKMFVRREAKRQFASPTIEQALEKFIRRKQRQRSILRAQLVGVDKAITLANELESQIFAKASSPPASPAARPYAHEAGAGEALR